MSSIARSARLAVAMALVVAAACAFAWSSGERVVFDQRSAYERIVVVDHGSLRSLRFGDEEGQPQTIIDLRDPRATHVEYLRMSASGLAFIEARNRALMVGLGGGSFAQLLLRLPGIHIDVAELDPLVVEVARGFFFLPADPRLAIHVEDGARFVARVGPSYDLVLLDAYGHEGIPPHLLAPSFFAAVLERIADGGVVVANFAYRDRSDQRSAVAEFARAFPRCLLLQGHRTGNAVVIGARQHLPEPLGARARIDVFDRTELLPFAVGRDVRSIVRCPASAGAS
jgi:spermidine synthase